MGDETARSVSKPASGPREIALRFVAHLDRGEIEQAVGLCALDAQIWVPGHPTFSPPQFRDFLTLSFDHLDPRSLTVKTIGSTAEGQRVAVEAHSAGRLKTGAEYENRYHFLFIVRDGSIRTLNVYATSGFALTAAWTSGVPRRIRVMRAVKKGKR
jgi:uncharacterized protein